jgi:hypothetical protein
MSLESKIAKIQKKLDDEYPGYSEAVNGMPITDLKESIITMSRGVDEIHLAKEKDKELEDLQSQVKELAAPYSDALKKAQLKLKYMNLLLKSKTDVQ